MILQKQLLEWIEQKIELKKYEQILIPPSESLPTDLDELLETKNLVENLLQISILDEEQNFILEEMVQELDNKQ